MFEKTLVALLCYHQSGHGKNLLDLNMNLRKKLASYHQNEDVNIIVDAAACEIELYQSNFERQKYD
jgi:hypothetical protein